MKFLSGAKTYLGIKDIELFRSRPELAHTDDAVNSYVALFDPDVAVHNGDSFQFGRTSIRAVSCPGHSPNETSYFFQVTDGTQDLIAGLHGGSGFNTICREYIETHKVNWRKDFLDSIERVMDERVDIFLGNHTPQNKTQEKRLMLSSDHNPFIDPQEWGIFLRGLLKQFDRMTEEERSQGFSIPVE